MSTKSYKRQIVSLTRAHFLFVIFFATYIIISHSANLIEPEMTLKRWVLCLSVLSTSACVWLLLRFLPDKRGYHNILLGLITVVDIIIVSALIYYDRGMASPAVALYAIPILSTAISHSKTAIMSTSILSFAAYAFVTIKYFVDNFNEGYKVQLYGTLGFYGACFFVLAFILIALTHSKD